MSVVIGLSRKLAIVASVSILATAGALAADMPDYPPVLLPPHSPAPLPPRVEYSSGWYLRGDFAYRFQGIGGSSSGDTAQVPDPVSAGIDNAFVFGLGAGLKQDWLRLDVTGDYGWRSKYSAASFEGKVESFTVMGNAYIDLGTWYGLTPYVGVGLGAANVIFSSYNNPTAVAPMQSSAPSMQRWNFAWAAMLGVSYNVMHNLLLDVGYRHIDMGDISGGPGNKLTVQSLTGDEIRIGLRYLID